MQSTLAKLELCRTVALGGHLYRCDPCDFECRVNNSCGDPIKLRGAEFVRRWSLHILPKGYTRTRRFGGYWNGRRKDYLAECRALLASAGVATVAAPEPAASSLTPPVSQDDTTPCCPKCKLKMRWIGFDEKPSWRILMYSPHRPQWYRDD